MDVNGSAAARPALSENEVAVREQQLSDNLMSPFCPGRTLFSCPSDEAGKLRTEIRGLFAAGKNRDQIETVLVRRYGEDILGVPRAEGVGVLIWVMPIAFVIIAAAVLFRTLRGTKGSFNEAGDPDVVDEYSRSGAEETR